MTNSKALRKLVESRGLKYKYIAGQIGITPYCLARKNLQPRNLIGGGPACPEPS